MAIDDREGRIFLSHPHMNNGFLFLVHHLIPHLYRKQTSKRLPENPEYAEKRYADVILNLNDVTDRRAASMQLFILYLPLGLVRVCKIEISHVGKNKGNSDLVCETLFSYWQFFCNSVRSNIIQALHNLAKVIQCSI